MPANLGFESWHSGMSAAWFVGKAPDFSLPYRHRPWCSSSMPGIGNWRAAPFWSPLDQFTSPAKCIELQQTCFKTATFSLRPMTKCVELHKMNSLVSRGGLQKCFACNVVGKGLCTCGYADLLATSPHVAPTPIKVAPTPINVAHPCSMPKESTIETRPWSLCCLGWCFQDYACTAQVCDTDCIMMPGQCRHARGAKSPSVS